MLLSYSAKNFYCFKEGIEVPLRLGKSCPESVANNKGVTDVLCVKGANGAGKSNALKILNFLSNFCCDSFSLKPEAIFDYKTFFDNDNPTDFRVEFEVEGTEYYYDLKITKKEILKETITRKNERKTILFERNKNKIVKNISEFEDLKKIKLRSNASIISTAHQYEVEQLNFVYSFFYKIVPSIDAALNLLSAKSFETINQVYYENENYLIFVKEILKKCDLGIKDFSIKKIEIDDSENKYKPSFIHENNGKDYELPLEQESNGTRNLYKQLFAYKLALETGGVFVLDEFDISLHPDILPLLVDLFTNEETNPKNAQFLFTTHTSAILNKLGKYRTILVNKEENESYLYRLDELPGDLIRNDRPLEPIYRSGRIGGVPRV